MRVGGLGNPGLRKSQSRASVFSSVKREEGRVGPAFQPWRLSSFESLDLKSLMCVCVCVCVCACVFVWVGDTAFVISEPKRIEGKDWGFQRRQLTQGAPPPLLPSLPPLCTLGCSRKKKEPWQANVSTP